MLILEIRVKFRSGFRYACLNSIQSMIFLSKNLKVGILALHLEVLGLSKSRPHLECEERVLSGGRTIYMCISLIH